MLHLVYFVGPLLNVAARTPKSGNYPLGESSLVIEFDVGVAFL